MSDQTTITGIAANGGTAEGGVRVVSGVADAADFPNGAVLVAELTEPSMVLMMNRASAIVTDYGGMTTHAAIVSRELGVPCVVGTQEATTTLANGTHVRVNGDDGTVTVIE